MNILQIKKGLLARILYKFNDYSQVIHIIIMVYLIEIANITATVLVIHTKKNLVVPALKLFNLSSSWFCNILSISCAKSCL